MSNANSASKRDWRDIAQELSKEKERSRISELARELAEALDRERALTESDLRKKPN